MNQTTKTGLSRTKKEPKRLKLYQPTIKLSDIYFPHPASEPLLKYNHDVDIVKFQNRFYACWNANETGGEHKPGQFNFLSWGDDFVHWSNPVRLFTMEGGADNPVEDDNQWQPSFINYHDKVLYCAWCTFNGEKTFVSSSTDGVHWTNHEVPSAPQLLQGQVIGFPTTHGLLTSKDVMMFPCSLPYTGKFIVGTTRYAAVLYSEDGGLNWEWSDPIEGMRWEQIGEDPAAMGRETIILWEPVLYEEPDGRMGLLVRNSTTQANPGLNANPHLEKSHHMVLYAYSGDHGRTWSSARPIEVDSVCSRPYAASGFQTPDSLLMVMNDNWVNIPKRISADRYYLSLYVAPTNDPDLLLPGPLLQPEGGRAYYPNGFVDNDKLYIAYTYSGIHSTVVEPLPDFNEPFLLPRESRSGLRFEENAAIFGHRHSSMGLVLTSELTRQPRLTLSFDFTIQRYNGSEFPLLTLGGKTRNGCVLSAVYSEERKSDCILLKLADNQTLELGSIMMKAPNSFVIEMGHSDFSVSLNGAVPLTIDTVLLRKICFGGLYMLPEWPVGVLEASDVRLDLDSIKIN